MIAEIIVFVAPFLVGYILVLLKIEAVNDFTEDFYDWLTAKNRNIHASGNKVARFTLGPLYSLFITINDLTESIANIGLKSGIRIAVYLYFLGFITLFFITIKSFLLVLVVAAVLIVAAGVIYKISIKARQKSQSRRGTGAALQDQSRTFVETLWPFFRSENTKARVGELFSVENVEVDIDGKIMTRQNGTSPKKALIGYIDIEGGIFDAREKSPVKLADIDDSGNVIPTAR